MTLLTLVLLIATVPSTASWFLPPTRTPKRSTITNFIKQSSCYNCVYKAAKKDTIYNNPKIYDLAFSYRDFHKEVSFLIEVHKQHALYNLKGKKPYKVLELAAGPARHSLDFFNRQLNEVLPSSSSSSSSSSLPMGDNHHEIVEVIASDLNSNMMDYGLKLVTKYQHHSPFKTFKYINLDMSNFIHEINLKINNTSSSNNVVNDNIEYRKDDNIKDGYGLIISNNIKAAGRQDKFDSVWCLLGSIAHLHQSESLEMMLLHVLMALKEGGTFIIELAHPYDVFNLANDKTDNEWEVKVDDTLEFAGHQLKAGDTLCMNWSDNEKQFNPITQVKNTTLRISVKRPDKNVRSFKLFEEMIALREYTIQEILSIVKHITSNSDDDIDKGYKYHSQVGYYGSMCLKDIDGSCVGKSLMVDIDDSDAHRLVVVLTKTII